MSTRVITDRELLHNLAFEVSELREDVASLHLRIERLALPLDADAARHSRRFELMAVPAIPIKCLLGHDHDDAGSAVDCNRVQADLERERVERCSCGRKVVAS